MLAAGHNFFKRVFMDLPSNGGQIDFYKLLNRARAEQIDPFTASHVKGKRIAVTGGGGSIGLELCRRLLPLEPSELLIFDHSEYALYLVEQVLSGPNVRLILGDVRHEVRLRKQFAEVDIVYHAAAYKHVHLVEANPCEGASNNVLGTYAVVRAASDAGVRNLVIVSTDKAIRPVGLMGATKLLAEQISRAFTANSTRLAIVRFGNVFESSGSVVPLFRRQIESGGPVTVTHPEMTRYFMTAAEAVQLVIQAGVLGQHGETFVLDMAEPVKILDLANALIQSEADDPASIPIEITGVRPGEKIHEEMIEPTNLQPTRHPRIALMREPATDASKLSAVLVDLRTAIDEDDGERVRDLIWSGIG